MSSKISSNRFWDFSDMYFMSISIEFSTSGTETAGRFFLKCFHKVFPLPWDLLKVPTYLIEKSIVKSVKKLWFELWLFVGLSGGLRYFLVILFHSGEFFWCFFVQFIEYEWYSNIFPSLFWYRQWKKMNLSRWMSNPFGIYPPSYLQMIIELLCLVYSWVKLYWRDFINYWWGIFILEQILGFLFWWIHMREFYRK